MERYRTTKPDRTAAFAAVTCLVLCLLAAGPSPAGTGTGIFASGSGRIHITADRMIMKPDERLAEFEGNVRAVQADTEIRAARLQIFYKPRADSAPGEPGLNREAIERVVAAGSVVIDFQEKTARCDRAVYTAGDGLLKLSGDRVSIESRDNVIAGREITLNGNTGEITVSGGGEKRVEAVFQSEPPSESGKTGKTEVGETQTK